MCKCYKAVIQQARRRRWWARRVNAGLANIRERGARRGRLGDNVHCRWVNGSGTVRSPLERSGCSSLWFWVLRNGACGEQGGSTQAEQSRAEQSRAEQRRMTLAGPQARRRNVRWRPSAAEVQLRGDKSRSADGVQLSAAGVPVTEAEAPAQAQRHRRRAADGSAGLGSGRR